MLLLMRRIAMEIGGDIETVTGVCIGGIVSRLVDRTFGLQMACLWRDVKMLDNRDAIYRDFGAQA